jgi:hypothetical protein
MINWNLRNKGCTMGIRQCRSISRYMAVWSLCFSFLACLAVSQQIVGVLGDVYVIVSTPHCNHMLDALGILQTRCLSCHHSQIPHYAAQSSLPFITRTACPCSTQTTRLTPFRIFLPTSGPLYQTMASKATSGCVCVAPFRLQAPPCPVFTPMSLHNYAGATNAHINA